MIYDKEVMLDEKKDQDQEDQDRRGNPHDFRGCFRWQTNQLQITAACGVNKLRSNNSNNIQPRFFLLHCTMISSIFFSGLSDFADQ